MLALLLLGELFLRENKTDVRCGIKIRALLELRPKAPYKCDYYYYYYNAVTVADSVYRRRSGHVLPNNRPPGRLYTRTL